MSNRLIMIATVGTALLAGSVSSQGATLIGGEGDDTINGTALNDLVFAKGGSDTVHGYAGDDFIVGGLGGGMLDGGIGADIIISTGLTQNTYGGPTEVAQTASLKMSGGDGDDLLILGASLSAGSEIDCGQGKDLLNFSIGVPFGQSRPPEEYQYIKNCEEWNFGGYPGDILQNHPANDQIPGVGYRLQYLGQNDSSNVVVTDDNVAGLSGKLTISLSLFPGRIVDASAVTLTGVIFKPVEICCGGERLWEARGSKADDQYFGTYWPDFFVGNGGNDYYDGGEGVDTAILSGNSADYTVTEVAYNSFTVRDNRPGSPDGTDTIVDVNKLQFADQTVDVVIRGLNIVGDGQADKLAGTGYADRLKGMGGNDDLSGNAGNDQIIGGTGADRMVGGSGDDSYDFDSTGDTATEASGGGVDSVRSSVSISALSAYVENLTLTGSAALNATGNSMNNVITGNAGANVLSGGGGSDRLIGGLGDDTYYGNSSGVPGTDVDTVSFEDRAAAVTFNLALTTVQATGGAGNDRIPNGSIENLVGGSGGDRLAGTNGANRIEGRAGNDTILGMLGPDVLIGNAGLDVINCGAETTNNVDTVTYLAAGDSVVGANRDQILNFKPGDRISLSAIDANVKVAGNQAFTFNMTTPRANSIWYVKSGANLIVKADVNGNTPPDFEILVKDRTSLLSTDFVP